MAAWLIDCRCRVGRSFQDVGDGELQLSREPANRSGCQDRADACRMWSRHPVFVLDQPPLGEHRPCSQHSLALVGCDWLACHDSIGPLIKPESQRIEGYRTRSSIGFTELPAERKRTTNCRQGV